MSSLVACSTTNYIQNPSAHYAALAGWLKRTCAHVTSSADHCGRLRRHDIVSIDGVPVCNSTAACNTLAALAFAPAPHCRASVTALHGTHLTATAVAAADCCTRLPAQSKALAVARMAALLVASASAAPKLRSWQAVPQVTAAAAAA
jgi:hypothetical protein